MADEAFKKANSGLLADVESGVILSKDNSVRYRHLFQDILHEHQNYLARFDAQLSVIADHAMQTDNNTQGQGISGHHDHHDLSALANFEEMLLSIEKLNTSRTFISRIVYANFVQKDLVDLISHVGVAPHTVSVGYEAPDQPWLNLALGAQFEAMLKAYKSAQFELVNSPQYWAAIDQGQSAYGLLILSVQEIVFSKTARWERRIAGRFLSLQTLAPPVDLVPSKRRIKFDVSAFSPFWVISSRSHLF